jgi:hypothetical protein
MPTGISSTPARFGCGQSTSDDRNLFLKVFGGEVLTAFTEAVITLDKHTVRSIEFGKSAQFSKTWKATSEYHEAGIPDRSYDLIDRPADIYLPRCILPNESVDGVDKSTPPYFSSADAESGAFVSRLLAPRVKIARPMKARAVAIQIQKLWCSSSNK